jgi:hypothetical protein
LALALATAAGCAATGAAAQSTSAPADVASAAAAASAAPVQPTAAEHKVTAGTLVEIEIAEPVSSKTHKAGDTFAIRLAEPVTFDGRVIVPAGTPGRGQVIDSGKPGIGGKPAKLVLAARYLEVDGKQLPLRAFKFGGAGVDRSNTAAALSAVPYAGVFGILVTGGQIEIAPGARGIAKLAQDVPVSDAAPAQAAVPAAIPASTPAPASAAPTPSTTPSK